jgi:hypothetical protein
MCNGAWWRQSRNWMTFTASYLVLLPQLFSQQTESIASNGGFEL